MPTEPSDTGNGQVEAPARPDPPAHNGAPTETLVSGTVGDRCVNCGAPLSSDQRYCVVCGERRGAPRFSLPATAGATPSQPNSTIVKSSRRPRFSPGTTLVAGVATLLLAVLVGVVIGRGAAGNTKTVAGSGGVKIVTVGSGSSTPAASSSSTGSGSSGSSATKASGTGGKSKKSGGGSKGGGKHSSKVAQQESNAAAKATGGSGTPPATVTVGQKGSGKGFNKKTHKFDGSFFGQ